MPLGYTLYHMQSELSFLGYFKASSWIYSVEAPYQLYTYLRCELSPSTDYSLGHCTRIILDGLNRTDLYSLPYTNISPPYYIGPRSYTFLADILGFHSFTLSLVLLLLAAIIELRTLSTLYGIVIQSVYIRVIFR
jgi:hypothetical protein